MKILSRYDQNHCPLSTTTDFLTPSSCSFVLQPRTFPSHFHIGCTFSIKAASRIQHIYSFTYPLAAGPGIIIRKHCRFQRQDCIYHFKVTYSKGVSVADKGFHKGELLPDGTYYGNSRNYIWNMISYERYKGYSMRQLQGSKC